MGASFQSTHQALRVTDFSWGSRSSLNPSFIFQRLQQMKAKPTEIRKYIMAVKCSKTQVQGAVEVMVQQKTR